MYTLHQGIALLAAYERLSVSWYLLEESSRPLASFAPDIVPVVPLTFGASAVPFYPKQVKRRVNRYPKRARQNANDEQPPLADDDGDDGIDEEALDQEVPGIDDEHEREFGDFESALAEVLEEASAELLRPLAAEDEEDGAPPPQEQIAEGALEEDLAPPPPPPIAEARGPRGKAAVTVTFPHGKISYYASKNSFEAICRNPAHGKCVLTRTAKGKPGPAGKPPKGGRPLGFMAAWLQHSPVADKVMHWSPEFLHGSIEARTAGREFIKGAHFGAELLAHERSKAEDLGEGSEPEDLTPYL